jgi:hypothetical protein
MEEDKLISSMMYPMQRLRPFIYNKASEDADIIIINEGYGDLYVVEKADELQLGDEERRLCIGMQKRFSGNKLFLLAGSYPVVSIIEVVKEK